MNSEKLILIVIPEEDTRNLLAKALHVYDCPYAYEIVSTVQEAIELLAKGNVQAMIMTPPAALGQHGLNGLITHQTELPPTITLIQAGDDFPDYLHLPNPLHDWCTMPFSLDELFQRLSILLERADK